MCPYVWTYICVRLSHIRLMQYQQRLAAAQEKDLQLWRRKKAGLTQEQQMPFQDQCSLEVSTSVRLFVHLDALAKDRLECIGHVHYANEASPALQEGCLDLRASRRPAGAHDARS